MGTAVYKKDTKKATHLHKNKKHKNVCCQPIFGQYVTIILPYTAAYKKYTKNTHTKKQKTQKNIKNEKNTKNTKFVLPTNLRPVCDDYPPIHCSIQKVQKNTHTTKTQN